MADSGLHLATVLVTTLLATLPHLVQPQQCVANTYGPNPSNRANNAAVPATTYQYLMATGETIGCNGVIRQWVFYYRNSACNDLDLQVWRPSGGQYELVGHSLHASVCGGGGGTETVDLNKDGVGELPVQPGDLIGWVDVGTTAGNRMIDYDQELSGSNMYGLVSILKAADACASTTGTVCDFMGAGTAYVRAYSLQATTQAGSAPIIMNLPATVQTDSNIQPSVFIFDVDAFNTFTYRDVIPPVLTYEITAVTGGGCAFTIDATTGRIWTTAALTAGTCTISVRSSEGGTIYSTTEDLTVTVNQIPLPFTITNPATPPGSASVIIDTNTAANGQLVYTVTTSAASTRIMKSTEPFNAPFVISAAGAITISNTNGLTNWLAPLHFQLRVIAENNYYSAGPVDIIVVLTNIRTAPVIDNLDNVVTLPENTLVATNIYRVTASSDPRAGGVVFALVSTYPQNTTAGMFTINAATGWVTYAIAPLDFYGTQRYDLEVSAQDNDGLLTGDLKNLTVQVTWVNSPPSFLLTAYVSTMPELEPVGTEVPGVTLRVDDIDLQVGDWLEYQLTDPGAGIPPDSDAYYFRADNITNKVYVNNVYSLNGLSTYTFSLDVHVIDAEGAQASPVATLTITITGLNAHSPVCSPAAYTGSVAADSTGGTAVGVTVTATDADGGVNGQISYSIQGSLPNLYFEIDATSGVVSTKQPIDWVLHPNMTFTVVARDEGILSRTDTAVVVVIVTPVNQHAPQWDPDRYSIELSADTRPGTEVLQLQVYDPDPASVSTPTMYLLTIQYDFRLQPLSGNLTVSRVLQANRQYLLYANARDQGVPTEYYTPYPAYIRVDTYDARSSLVDIHLYSRLENFDDTADAFLNELAQVLFPWQPKIQKSELRKDKTIVTIYALDNNGTVYEGEAKSFVSKTDLLGKLRVNLQGMPTPALLGPEFSQWQPYLVQPTHADWLTETPGGVAVLTLICLVALVGLIVSIVLCLKYKAHLGFKNGKRTGPTRAQGPGTHQPNSNEFKLSYADNPDDKKGGKGKFGPIVPLIPPTGSYLSATKMNSKAPSSTPILTPVNIPLRDNPTRPPPRPAPQAAPSNNPPPQPPSRPPPTGGGSAA